MILNTNNLTKIFGDGCSRCISSTGSEAGNSICPHCQSIVAVNSVNIELNDGEVLGIVGESGSGKSTLLKLLYRDIDASQGKVFLNDFKDKYGKMKDIMKANLQELKWLRTSLMSIIYQNPALGLNFHFSAGGNIAEKIIMKGENRYRNIREKALYFMDKTELPLSRVDNYPDKFSGGQQQRVQISKAMSSDPKLLLLDEPTTGLDLSVQAKILDLIKILQKKLGFAMIIVSHDLGVIKHLTDITVVMKNGEIVEKGLTDQILEDPFHPYTQLIVSSIL
ncbi:ATP-binding cassette domain-containing protein [Flexistipes sp.]|uniref:ATP-binding cassette domain-containing protein n=1 Tax=Flexistipes sp. TaxID=3088135 RepID=UPI002E1A445D|nr:ATP-binding cassette domain-containing protein [Flexistipes sp.]